MDINVERLGPIAVFALAGRFDAFGSKSLEPLVEQELTPQTGFAIFDMTGVNYLSSAGIRVMLAAQKRLAKVGGALALAGVQPYCRGVLEMAGMLRQVLLFDTAAEARRHCVCVVRERSALSRWDELEKVSVPAGTFRFVPGDKDPCEVRVAGRIKDVLEASITSDMVYSRRFSEAEYSIGLGGLGENIGDFFEIMGEMITIGGTMVWLPTDGNDTPDFFIPKHDTGAVLVRTAFNAALSGGFNEFAMFEARKAEGATLESVYRSLFNLAKARRADYRGVIALAAWAQVEEVFSSGIRRAPIRQFAPENGESIISQLNIGNWFDLDKEPRHRGVTCLICGLGADLESDLSAVGQHGLDTVFYLHPNNTAGKTQLLHNHAAIFSRLEMPERMSNLDVEIKRVVDRADFMDMRHLLDNSTVSRAFLGISYVQGFSRDEGAVAGLSTPPPAPAKPQPVKEQPVDAEAYRRFLEAHRAQAALRDKPGVKV